MIARFLDWLLSRLATASVLDRSCCRWPWDDELDASWKARTWVQREMDVAEGRGRL